MTQFDASLRRGLMDANLSQYRKSLLQAGVMEPGFSSRYLRERNRMLADPWGWVGQRSFRRGKRLDWRLIAAAAALLILSACAYAAVTGQFSQWFPNLGVNPNSPETSEEVLSGIGSVIGQSQTAGDATATLNAVLWDGKQLYISLTVESPGIPEEARPYNPLYSSECYWTMRDDQWREYTRKDMEYAYGESDMTQEQIEEEIQKTLDGGQEGYTTPLNVLSREGSTINLQTNTRLLDFVENPELTLHLENIGPFIDGEGNPVPDENGFLILPGPGEFFLEGPMDFTFTLGKPTQPIQYEGEGVEASLGEIPLRLTGLTVSVMDLTVRGKVLAPMDIKGTGEDPDALVPSDITMGAIQGPWGLWLEDGTYLDITSMAFSGGASEREDGGVEINITHDYPYPLDPASVTAVNIGGTRVEIGEPGAETG